MKATGIVRRVDDLGRVVIPKELCRQYRIREGDPLEVYIDKLDGQPVICFRKYETGFMNSLTALADAIDEEMMGIVTDKQRGEVRDLFNEIAKILKKWENEA